MTTQKNVTSWSQSSKQGERENSVKVRMYNPIKENLALKRLNKF